LRLDSCILWLYGVRRHTEMTELFRDLRYALRMFRASPGFALVAIIALALGIGSTTAIFSVVNAMLLQPLPYHHADRIVTVSSTDLTTGVNNTDASPANYLDWKTQNQVFSEMAAARSWRGNLTGSDHPERILGAMTTASFFPLFAVQPILGRALGENDASAGNDHVVVLSFGLWQKVFAGDQKVLGHTITLDGEPYTVVGVMPHQFSPEQYAELWLPSRWDVPSHPLAASRDPRQFRDRNYLQVWARLKPHITLQQARVQMDAIGQRLAKQYPDANRNSGIAVVPMREDMVGDVRPVLLVLLGAVGMVLLIGCANVANLLLARATARAREIAIRTALGATRGRLIRQLLTESVLLALAGGVAGVFLASWGVRALLTLSPSDISRFDNIGVNVQVLGFTLAVSFLSGVLFGLIPALHTSDRNPNERLRENSRGATSGHNRTRSVLVSAEIGFSVILLIGAGLLVKSFIRLMNVDPGFNSERLLVFSIAPTPSTEPSAQLHFYQRVMEQLRAIPGVQSVGAVSRLPLAGGNSQRDFRVPGDNNDYNADYRVTMPGYFRAMGIPLLKGRDLDEHDAQNEVPVVVINQELARTTFPGQDPIGKYITNFNPDSDQKAEIVGVVGNVRHVGLDTVPHPEMYLPLGPEHWFSVTLEVRTSLVDPMLLVPAAQNAVWSVNKDVPLSNVKSMETVVSDSVMRRRFGMVLLSILAGLAMLLAAIGLYGVVSYSVSQRTQEIGIRMALGAKSADVLRLVVREGMKSAWIGVAVGLALSVPLTRFLSSLLYAVGANDPLILVLIPLLLAVVVLLASYIPARRATKVDPMVALRYE